MLILNRYIFLLKRAPLQRLDRTVVVSVHVTLTTLGHVTSVMVPAIVEMGGKVSIVQRTCWSAMKHQIYVEINQCARKQPGHINVSANLDIRNLQKDTVKVGF